MNIFEREGGWFDDMPTDIDLHEQIAMSYREALAWYSGENEHGDFAEYLASVILDGSPTMPGLVRAQIEAKALEDAADKSRHRDAFATDGVDIFLLQLADDIRKEHGLRPYRRVARGEPYCGNRSPHDAHGTGSGRWCAGSGPTKFPVPDPDTPTACPPTCLNRLAPKCVIHRPDTPTAEAPVDGP